jgi:Ca-activated chloride channel family protein
VVEVVQNFWYYTKRPTNVYLVVDTSGSMEEGNKLPRTQEALRAFVGQIQGDRDQLGLVEFASGSKNFTPLRQLDENVRSDLLKQIERMEPIGGTALIDAVYNAANDLLAQNDSEAINALVVMTDGQENESSYTVDDLNNLLQSHPNQRLVIFTIAFGSDADEQLLQEIANIGNGQFRRASETDIEELYKIISTYF